jgi:hypothetical protein
MAKKKTKSKPGTVAFRASRFQIASHYKGKEFKRAEIGGVKFDLSKATDLRKLGNVSVSRAGLTKAQRNAILSARKQAGERSKFDLTTAAGIKKADAQRKASPAKTKPVAAVGAGAAIPTPPTSVKTNKIVGKGAVPAKVATTSDKPRHPAPAASSKVAASSQPISLQRIVIGMAAKPMLSLSRRPSWGKPPTPPGGIGADVAHGVKEPMRPISSQLGMAAKPMELFTLSPGPRQRGAPAPQPSNINKSPSLGKKPRRKQAKRGLGRIPK